MEDTLFTKIIKREIPATIYFEDDHFIVIKDIHPMAPVHALIITKQQFASLEEVDRENTDLMGKLIQTARNVAQQLNISENYKLVMNVGKNMQAVPHVHLHLMGGWENPSIDTKVGM